MLFSFTHVFMYYDFYLLRKHSSACRDDSIIVEFKFVTLNLGAIRAMKFEAVRNSSLAGMNNGLTQVVTKRRNNR